ncbi:ATP-binding cassette domain-containing protein [Edaphobacter sp. HDX4]|uniref:ATP-binding cassette domain-containing protein n=1 Tax=Edaphobacter sp. HDX4 TaxID=2794064 RepID=UPI002FE658D0
MSFAVALQDVSFGYDVRSPILQVNRLNIQRGKKIFIHGVAGSGKTTLLGLIAGILRPQRGTCEVLGRELTHLSLCDRDHHRGSEMGCIFQRFNLIPYLTVKENIELPCRVHSRRQKGISATSLDREVLQLAEKLDLHRELDSSVSGLDTGQQQRVALARAIIGKPPLIIADEPVSAHDGLPRQRFLQLLLELCGHARATLIFASHDRSLMPHFEEHISIAEINSMAPGDVSGNQRPEPAYQ